MSRILKFRAFDKKDKKMFPPFSLDEIVNCGGFCLPSSWNHVNVSGPSIEGNNDLVYLQWTGLKDKNGKDIYEGDILSFEFENLAANYKSVVEWKPAMTECCQSSFDGYETKNFQHAYIIGNVHENPELLK